MKKNLSLLFVLSLIACGGSDEEDVINNDNVDPIIGVWNEELEEGSSFSSIIWVFNSDGSLSLSFDGSNTSSGQWEFLGSNLDGTKRYTLDFIQYPNEGKFTFAVSPNFSSNNTRMNIRLYQGSQQWIRDRVLVKD